MPRSVHASIASDTEVPLAQRVMIARLETHRWHAQKRHRQSEEAVAKSTGTQRERHKHTILLLADKALENVNTAFSAASIYHRTNTSPWEDGGMRLLTNRRYTAYMIGIGEHERAVKAAVAEFVRVYPDLVNHERANNKLFNEADYPMPGEIAGKFGINTIIDKIQSASDFTIDGMDPATVTQIQASIESRVQAKIKGVQADIWKRAFECVDRIADRLVAFDEREERLAAAMAKQAKKKGAEKRRLPEGIDKSGTFTGTLITNLRELVEIMPDLDFTDDPALAQMRQRLLSQLCVHDSDELKESPLLRQRIAGNAKAIRDEVKERLDALSDFL